MNNQKKYFIKPSENFIKKQVTNNFLVGGMSQRVNVLREKVKIHAQNVAAIESLNSK